MLSIHRAERADTLVGGLAEMLAEPPADPFTPDVVAVPSRGVERWIAQALSVRLGTGPTGRDGVCAQVEFPSPRALTSAAVAAATGVDPDDDPWAPARLPWHVLRVLDQPADGTWRRLLDRHLAATGRRVAVAQRLATLLESYAAQRPDMVVAWAAGDDTDGAGGVLPTDLVWQAELWRRVRDAVGAPGPAERLGPAIAALTARPGPVDRLGLPDRLSVVGPTRLATDELRVLEALAVGRDVHLWLPHPSHDLWQRLADASGAGGPTPPARIDDTTARLPRHPLLSSMGRDSRELAVRLAGLRIDADHHVEPAPTDGPVTLLERLQADVHADRAPSVDEHRLAPDDRSVQVHACHGRQRQVEVVRDVVTGLLADDPSLELRDVVLMCPDVEAYAPLVSAAFGLAVDDESEGETAGPSHPAQRFRVRLADRSVRRSNPVLGVLARLLELVDGRWAASDLLGVAAMPPVRRRFHLDDDALELLDGWVRRSGVRWGLGPEGRAAYGLGRVPQNTWRTGLDRILTGVAMDETGLRSVGLALPLDDVDSGDVDLAGRLAELVDRVDAAADRLVGTHSLRHWHDALLATLDDLVDVSPSDAWQLTSARLALADVLAAAESVGSAESALSLADVRALLADRFRGRPTRASFRTGDLTLCSMVPMRSVPHRVVVLLGLDDGVFPRHTRRDGDDVLVRTPLVGDRDARTEDRQLFLDALLAATQHLVVLYTGADERTGALRPPAVPLGELLDVLDRTATPPPGVGRVRDHVVRRHPLQPFDPIAFTAPATSFDRVGHAGARALLAETRPRPARLGGRLDPVAHGEVVELDRLVEAVTHPVRAFVKGRLDVALLSDDDEVTDALSVDPNGLERWAVGNRMLRVRLAGASSDDAVRAEWLRGDLPPGPLGREFVTEIATQVDRVVAESAGARVVEPDQVDVSVELTDGRRLVGTVAGVRDGCAVEIAFSSLKAAARLRAWVALLALQASHPDRGWTTFTMGSSRRGGTEVARLAGLDPEHARRELTRLVALRDEILCEPLPLPVETARAYAEARVRSRPAAALVKAGTRWRRVYDGRPIGEGTDAYHRWVWGDVELTALLDADLVGRAPDDAAALDETTRFGALSRRLWGPVLDLERGTR